MKPIIASLDKGIFNHKPSGTDIARISSRIAHNETALNSASSIRSFAQSIATKGQTFCTATFKDGRRCKEDFLQQQLFALDFDNKDESNFVSFDDVKQRADDYDLPILFAYETFSSTKHDKFRVVFLNDVPITDRPVAEAMQYALSEIFPEADTSCCNDVSKMYFGGNQSDSLYFNDSLPEINIDTIFRSLTFSIRNTKGSKHYKEKIKRFANKSGISLNNNGLLDISISDEPFDKTHLTEENSGATTNPITKNGGNSPTPIIYNYVKDDGENPPLFYQIKFNDNCNGTSNSSVSRITSVNPAANHKLYRSNVINELVNCRLFRDFISGTRKLSHDEIFHILNNMINIETGISEFISIISKFPELYGSKIERWKEHADYNKKQGYYPSRCSKYCQYCNNCEHGSSILATVHKSCRQMERIAPEEHYFPLNVVESDTYNAIYKAFLANDDRIHVIKAQTAIGKSTSFLKIVKENPDCNFLIAVPTNLLKDEMHLKAQRMGISMEVTPSLEPIMSDLPIDLQIKINHLYNTGRANVVHEVIKRALKKDDIPELAEYMDTRQFLFTYIGNLITTHRYLLSMDDERLDKFDCIIVDEDIIFKSVISNQGEITVSDLKKLGEKISDERVHDKITDILDCAEIQSCVLSKGFKWDSTENIPKKLEIDIPAFCSAEYFYYRSAKEDPSISEDVVSFIKPVSLSKRKHIIVSATADENIYGSFFGADRVRFYECKRAQYKGQLRQYYKKSMSRSCIENNPDIVDELQQKLDIDDEHVITFKKQDIGSLHFGNTEGSNSLEGEDILVIGTPYHADFLYKLVAFSLDIDFDEDEKAEMQLIEHNGYRTEFTTFKNKELREIQFWMLESELEQAVGRARLLRKDCTVHLFSNFPLSQAIMMGDFKY